MRDECFWNPEFVKKITMLVTMMISWLFVKVSLILMEGLSIENLLEEKLSETSVNQP